MCRLRHLVGNGWAYVTSGALARFEAPIDIAAAMVLAASSGVYKATVTSCDAGGVVCVRLKHCCARRLTWQKMTTLSYIGYVGIYVRHFLVNKQDVGGLLSISVVRWWPMQALLSSAGAVNLASFDDGGVGSDNVVKNDGTIHCRIGGVG